MVPVWSTSLVPVWCCAILVARPRDKRSAPRAWAVVGYGESTGIATWAEERGGGAKPKAQGWAHVIHTRHTLVRVDAHGLWEGPWLWPIQFVCSCDSEWEFEALATQWAGCYAGQLCLWDHD